MSRSRTYDLFWMSDTLADMEARQQELKDHHLASSAYVRWGRQLFHVKEIKGGIFEEVKISSENLAEFDRRTRVNELRSRCDDQKKSYSARKGLCLEEVVIIESLLSGRYYFPPSIEESSPVLPFSLCMHKVDKLIFADTYVTVEPVPDIPKNWNIPIFNRDYLVERTTLRKKLIQSFPVFQEPESKKARSKPVVLTACHGLGGIGKTQLALDYVQHATQSYAHCIWFNAESAEQLYRDYRQFCYGFHIKLSENATDDQVCTEVNNWFSINFNWLVVYDHAPDNKNNGIASFFPKGGRGDILVTSRFASGWLGHTILVDKLKKKQAIKLVKRRIRKSDTETKLSGSEETALLDLVEKLDCLPLALAQASAYLANLRGQMTIAKYLTIYQEFLDKEALPSVEYPQSVAKTWVITMRQIESRLPEAAQVLRGCAYLSSNTIPQVIVKSLVEGLYKSRLKDSYDRLVFDIIECLLNYSMVDSIVSSREDQRPEEYIGVHRLVQQVMRDRDKDVPSGDRQLFIEQVLKSLQVSCPKDADQKGDRFKRRYPWVAHLKAAIGYYEEVRPKNLEEKKLEENSAEISLALAKSLLGEIYILDWSQPQQARAYLEPAWKVLSKQEPRGIDAIWTQVQLGNAYKDLNLEKAKDLLERSLQYLQGDFKEEQLKIAYTLTNLSHVYYDMNMRDEACSKLEKALEIERDYYHKEDNFVMVPTLSNLGIIYMHCGNLKKARETLNEALRIGKKYNQRHFIFARTQVNLGILLCEKYNELKEALKLLEDALPNLEKHYGKEHIEVAHTQAALAITYYRLNMQDKALGMQKKSLKVLENALESKDYSDSRKVRLREEIAYLKRNIPEGKPTESAIPPSTSSRFANPIPVPPLDPRLVSLRSLGVIDMFEIEYTDNIPDFTSHRFSGTEDSVEVKDTGDSSPVSLIDPTILSPLAIEDPAKAKATADAKDKKSTVVKETDDSKKTDNSHVSLTNFSTFGPVGDMNTRSVLNAASNSSLLMPSPRGRGLLATSLSGFGHSGFGHR